MNSGALLSNLRAFHILVLKYEALEGLWGIKGALNARVALDNLEAK